eukprot:scaffold334_cov241-Pinguiococcus_pyrenoidosus.AAC.3
MQALPDRLSPGAGGIKGFEIAELLGGLVIHLGGLAIVLAKLLYHVDVEILRLDPKIPRQPLEAQQILDAEDRIKHLPGIPEQAVQGQPL